VSPADGNADQTAAVAPSAADPTGSAAAAAPPRATRMEGTTGWGLWFSVLRGPLVIAVLFAIVIAVGSEFDVYVAGTIAIYGLASAGQGWLMGRAGQVSLGGGALFAVGAFAAAFTTQVHGLAAFPLPLIAAGLAGAVVGAGVAVPGLRFRGVYLLLATLALLYVVQFVGERLQQNVTYLAGERLYRTQAGREWASVKENEIASAAMGIRVRPRKVQAFVGSSVVTAVAGGLFAYYIGLVSYTAFDLNLTLQLVVMVFIGGAATAIGPVVGAAIVTLLPYLLNDTVGHFVQAGWYSQNGPFVEQIIYGLALALILLYARSGLAGLRAVAVRLLRRKRAVAEDEPATAAATHAAAVPGPETVPWETVTPLPETVTSVPETVTPAPEPEAATAAGPREASAAAGTDAEPTSEGAPVTPANRTAPSTTGQAILSVFGLTVRYAGAGVAVQDVSLEVRDGAILGVLGRNGAGKSTLLKSIGGFPPSERVRLSGHVRIGETELSGRSPEFCTRHGVVLVPEQGKVFPALTVREHFALAGARGKAVTETLRKTGLTMLERRLDSYAASLSGGERQFLALSVAVLRQPRLLLVDEMSLGLAPIAVTEVGKAILRIRETTGCAVILVEQSAPVAAAIADELAVLENGQVVWRGLPQELPADALETAYFGAGAGGDTVRRAGL
jgi:ABC-type branched-subunit amino acid transport system ATPase component/ABC-type branched-subunit amino acid transport system permease subunit